MADLKAVSGEALEQAVKDGYTPILTWVVVYPDREVIVPEQRYLDTIEAERHFKAAYDNIRNREEVTSWLLWLRLKRHQDPAEHPPEKFDEWLASVVRPELKAEIDLGETPVPLEQ